MLIASLDIPSIKNLKVGMQTLDLLSLAGSKLHLVMNRANARVHLDIADVERALGVTAEFRIPSDIAIPQAVNRGVPVVLDKPRAPAGARVARRSQTGIRRWHRPRANPRRQPSRDAAAGSDSEEEVAIMSQQYSRWQDLQQKPGVTRTSQLEELRLRVHQFVIDQVGPMLADDAIGEVELRRLVQEQVNKSLGDEQTALSAAERAQLIQDVTDDALGYGPIDRFLHDPGITEVMVNGPKSVYIERRGKIEPTDVEFVDEDHLRRTIDKIVSQVGRRIDEASPMVDARLPDGSRVNAVIHPVAIGGPFLTIRRFSKEPYTVEDLINFGIAVAASRATSSTRACAASSTW